ncbi:protein cornichon homolog 1-like [Bidens hawaiensis]|uniref:protein cornichon homolog 1-like n=1 Tax=Bidens hawaiensis TaxID=980011 RepID=UPI0040490D2A
MGLVLYQIMCFLDLEIDCINPYELATMINNITLPEYIRRRHLVYATEAFSKLSKEKNQRFVKLVYLGVLLFFSDDVEHAKS